MVGNEYLKDLNEWKNKFHKNCLFLSNPLDLDFHFSAQNDLCAEFNCHDEFQGYDGKIHGGVIASLVDYVMTQFLFARKITALTSNLNLKYLQPLLINKKASIVVHLENQIKGKIYYLSTKIFQEGRLKVSADAKFWKWNCEEKSSTAC